MIDLILFILSIFLFGFLIGTFIGESIGYNRGARDEAERTKPELVGFLKSSISSTQSTHIEVMPLKDRIGKAYPKGTGVYLYRKMR